MSLNDAHVKERYYAVANKITENQIWILTEGDSNKFFYQMFKELEKIPMKHGGSCNAIVSAVNSNRNYYGIVDRDFIGSRDNQKIFEIDFYSIENIVLVFHNEFKELQRKISYIVNNSSIEEVRINKLDTYIDRDLSNLPINFRVTLSNNYHQLQYHNYIEKNINNLSNLYKYGSLKNVIKRKIVYLNQMNKIKKNRYLFETYCSISNPNLSMLFGPNVLSRIKTLVNQIKVAAS